MIFSTETVSANNLESFLFIAFLLVFALAASAYVWTKGKFDFSSFSLDSQQVTNHV
jgi:magnesium-transporting ATPase (P-type)